MFGSTRVHYEASAPGWGMGFGGIAAVHRLMMELRLVKQVAATLELLKVHLQYHGLITC